MSDSNRIIFGAKLRSHDWYFGYSDDHRYWTRGRTQLKELNAMHENLSCPYDMKVLKQWAHDMIVENFAEESPGEWYLQPRKYKCAAPTRREDLMTQKEWDVIQEWFDKKSD